jgi:tetratricopeptide (TPR) repeat protein
VRWLAAALLGILVPGLVSAQDAMAKAFDLERRGSYLQAADIYRAILQDRPAEVAALLGLERALTPLNRVPDMLPVVRTALSTPAPGATVYGIAVRVYASANLLDSLGTLAEAWHRAAPGDETPYREWAAAALQRRDRPMARRAYQLGRERLGKPEALAAEIAQLAVLEEDWPAAVREWARAVRQLPGYRTSAVATLGAAPIPARPEILAALSGADGIDVARIAVDLKAQWGDPLGGFEALKLILPSAAPQALDQLQSFLEEVRSGSSPEYLLAQARTLEAIAQRWANPAQRARLRLDAARAFVGAGAQADARAVLTALAQDTTGNPAVALGATATLIELLAREGKPDEAGRELDRYRATLPVDDYQRLRRLVALCWAQHGDGDRAEALIASDSSVDALELKGRLRLYAGDLKGAGDFWQQAGPFAGGRPAATARAATLAVIQPIEADSLPELGAAFRQLDVGDTLSAARGLIRVARTLKPEGGRPEVLLLAGRLMAARGQRDSAEAVLRAAVEPGAPATAAAALLELGQLLLASKRGPEAVAVLERMILDFPASALLPEARRVLDQARNAVPPS